MKPISQVREGDLVRRLLSDKMIPMDLQVTAIRNGLIICGAWTFDQETGIEEDEELGWGRKTLVTGSRLVGVLEETDQRLGIIDR